MEETIRKRIGEEVQWVTPKTSKEITSFFDLMNQVMAGSSSEKRFKKNTIAVMHLSGPIVGGKDPSSGSIVAGPTVEMIEKMTKDSKVKGVVVRVNSPGGSATASEEIRQALIKLTKAKPVVISMGQVAASGGYWISCVDAPVFAEKGTVTGSIGVFAMKIGSETLMRRLGVHSEVISLDDSANRNYRTWSDDDKKLLQKSIDRVYGRFLQLVSEARGIPVKDLDDLAGGRVWSGSQALEFGLIDHLGGTDDCVALIAKKVGLGDDFNVAHRPLSKSGLDLSEYLGSDGDDDILSGLGIPVKALQLLGRRGLDLRQTRLLINDSLSADGVPTIWSMLPHEFSIE